MGDDASMDIQVTGDGSGAVTAIDSVSNSANNLVSKFDDLKESATSPYEHAGMYLFSRQLLGTVGLSDVARHAMGAIVVAMDGVAAAAGTTTAVLAPWLLAIGFGIVAYEKFGKSVSATSDEAAKQKADFEALTKSLTDFYDTQAKVSQTGRELAGIEMGQKAGEIRAKQQELAGYTAQLDQSNAKIAEQRRQFEATTKGMTALAQKYGPTTIAFQEFVAAQERGQVSIKEHMASTRGEIEKLQPEYDKLKLLAGGASTASTKAAADQAAAAQKADEAFDKMMDKADAMSDSYAKSYQKAGQEIDHFLAKQKAQIEIDNGTGSKDAEFKAHLDARTAQTLASYDTMEDKAREYGLSTVALEESKDARIKSEAEKLKDEQITFIGDVGNAFGSTFQSAAGAVGQALGQMATQHKNFHDTTLTLWKDMESQIISMIASMAIKWAMFTALSGGAGAAMGMSPGMISSLTGIKAASGFDGLVGSPTTFTAGEAGSVERVSISPLGSGGGGASGGGSGPGGNQNYQISVTVQAAGVVTDVNAFANKVGQQLAQQIRGGGQVSLVRAG